LVGSLNKPGGNATGAVQLGKQLVAKQFELLHDLMPKADAIAFLVNPKIAATEDELPICRGFLWSLPGSYLSAIVSPVQQRPPLSWTAERIIRAFPGIADLVI
jgi:hypothetical protein